MQDIVKHLQSHTLCGDSSQKRGIHLEHQQYFPWYLNHTKFISILLMVKGVQTVMSRQRPDNKKEAGDVKPVAPLFVVNSVKEAWPAKEVSIKKSKGLESMIRMLQWLRRKKESPHTKDSHFCIKF